MAVVLTQDVNEMKGKRNALVNDIRTTYEQQKGEWTSDRRSAHEEKMKDVQAYTDHITALESAVAAAEDIANLNTDLLEGSGSGEGATSVPRGEDRHGFKNVKTVGFRTMQMGNVLQYDAGPTETPEYRSAFRDYCRAERAPTRIGEGKTFDNVMQWGGDHGEHNIIAPMQFHSEFLTGCDKVSIMRQLSTVIPMSTIRNLGIRKRTKKTASFAWGGVCKRPTADEPGIGLREMALNHASYASCVCRDLLRRTSGFDVEGYIASELSRDAGENMEQAYMLGDGVKKPLGIFVADPGGIDTDRDVTSSVVDGIMADDLIRMKMHLCVGCRQGGAESRLSWIMPTGMLLAVMLLKDGNGNYLWRPGLTEGFPDRILGHPVWETNCFTADISGGNYVAIIGDFGRYWILDGPSIGLERDLEIFDDQVCWVGRSYTDGMPIEDDCFARLIVASE